jgi:hypothetical protein
MSFVRERMELEKVKFRSSLFPDLDVKVQPHRTGIPVFIGVGPRTAVGVVVKIKVSTHAQNHKPEKKFNNITAILLTTERVSFPHSEMKGTALTQ